MALSDNDLLTLRGIIGAAEPPEDSDLEDAYDRLGSIYQVAYEVLQTRLATLIAEPAQFSVPGYSENKSANINALTTQLAGLDKTLLRLGQAPGSAAGTVKLSRPRASR